MDTKKKMSMFLMLAMYVGAVQAVEDNRPYSIQILTGDKLKELMPFVTTQRVLAFSSYPYLYVGDFAQEMEDFKSFADSKDSAIAVAYHGKTPVGLLTGCPLQYSWPDQIDDFNKVGVDPQACYYVPEIIVLPEYRGKKLSPQLVIALESYAKNLGYEKISLITESHDKHLMKPDNYKSLDSLWNHFKYQKTPLKLHLDWQTYQPDGTVREQKHRVNFWVKKLGIKQSKER